MTTNQGLTKYVVWAPDHTDAGALERRLAVRQKHLERALQLNREGTFRVGGALLSSDSANATGDPKLCGSCVILEAPSLEAARKVIEEDIYYTTGVWDKEKLQILPFMLMTPLPPLSASGSA